MPKTTNSKLITNPKGLFLKPLGFLALLLALALSGCTALTGGSQAPLPTIVLDQASSATQSPSTGAGVVASGVVAPGRQAQLVFALGGSLDAVNVVLGDTVQSGQTLARLAGQESLQAAVSAAQFELTQCEQAIKDLQAQDSSALIAAMQQMVAYAQQVKDAQYALANYTIPASQAGMDALQALTLMQQRLDEARAAYAEVQNLPEGDSTRQDRKADLDKAQSEYNSAVRRFQLEYNVKIAQAQFAQAQSDYANFQSGPDADRLRLAEARRANAETQLAAAQAALKNLAVAAPFAGTVTALNVHPGEWVLPGQPILTLVDVANLHVETTDLSERDIPKIALGQAATVYIKALNLEVTGKVTAISPLANLLGGDVVYRVTVVLDEIPAGLRAGMTVEVRFSSQP